MTDTAVYTEENKRDQDNRVHDALAASDFELQELLDWIFGPEDEGEEASFSITLSLPSGVMAGLVIPRKVWTRRTNEALRSAGAEKLADVRQRTSDDYEPLRKDARAAREAEGRPLPPRQFIHLKDVQLKSGGETFNLHNARVNLAHVSAWDLSSWASPTAGG